MDGWCFSGCMLSLSGICGAVDNTFAGGFGGGVIAAEYAPGRGCLPAAPPDASGNVQALVAA